MHTQTLHRFNILSVCVCVCVCVLYVHFTPGASCVARERGRGREGGLSCGSPERDHGSTVITTFLRGLIIRSSEEQE